MDKLDPKTDGASKDIVADNIDKLRELFPDAFTEGSDANGPRWKVDFDALRACLGEYVEDERERYSFTWNGKARARRIAQTPSTGTLRPCPEESVNWDTTQNLFIEGDNLEVLKLLQKSYHKQVKMIYIDPPYNTGGEFIYPDRFQDNLDTYLRYTGQVDGEGFKTSANSESAGRYHTNWLNMMYPRLKAARALLNESGSIWISIDDGELANLTKICEEIFGEENFIALFVWEKRKSRENRRAFSFNHDYILCFAKNKNHFEAGRNSLPLTDEAKARYTNPDDDPRGPWQSVALTAQAGHGTAAQFYTIKTPSGRNVDPPSGNCWRVTEIKLNDLIADNRIWFGENGANVPRRKSFLSENEGGLTPTTLWKASEVGTTDSAKRALNRLFDGITVFDTPKPIDLIQRICQISMNENDLAMDFFAGSGPLSESIANLNSADDGRRRYIEIQLPEPCSNDSEPYKAGLKTISSIAIERKKRIRTKLSNNTDYKNASVDTGFRIYKLFSSNLTQWAPDAKDIEASLLATLEHIRADRSSSDIVAELLLKYGLDLAVPVEERKIKGKAVYVIGAGALLVCLADAVDLDLVNGIAALKAELAPEVMRVVFKDNGFADDVVKTNAVQILRQAGVDDVKSL